MAAVWAACSLRSAYAADLDYVAFYDKPLVKFERLLETYLDYAPRGFSSFLQAMPLWMREKLWLPDLICSELARVDGEDHPKKIRRRAAAFPWKVFSETTMSHTQAPRSILLRLRKPRSSRSMVSENGPRLPSVSGVVAKWSF